MPALRRYRRPPATEDQPMQADPCLIERVHLTGGNTDSFAQRTYDDSAPSRAPSYSLSILTGKSLIAYSKRNIAAMTGLRMSRKQMAALNIESFCDRRGHANALCCHTEPVSSPGIKERHQKLYFDWRIGKDLVQERHEPDPSRRIVKCFFLDAHRRIGVFAQTC